jgi:hypothetical protein
VSPPDGDDDIDNLGAHAIDRLGLSPEVREELKEIQAELLAGYQESFVTMVNAIERQASAIERLQYTLNLLIENTKPDLVARIPLSVRVVDPGEDADVSARVVLADPIAAGYTLTQARIAEALKVSASDVSILVRAFDLARDDECAVTVRKGTKTDVVNYHARAIDRFVEHVRNPPENLSAVQQHALDKVRAELIASGRLSGDLADQSE